MRYDLHIVIVPYLKYTIFSKFIKVYNHHNTVSYFYPLEKEPLCPFVVTTYSHLESQTTIIYIQPLYICPWWTIYVNMDWISMVHKYFAFIRFISSLLYCSCLLNQKEKKLQTKDIFLLPLIFTYVVTFTNVLHF